MKQTVCLESCKFPRESFETHTCTRAEVLAYTAVAAERKCNRKKIDLSWKKQDGINFNYLVS